MNWGDALSRQVNGRVANTSPAVLPKVWVVMAPNYQGDTSNGIALAQALNPEFKLIDPNFNAANLMGRHEIVEYDSQTRQYLGRRRVTNDMLPDILIDSTHMNVAHALSNYRKSHEEQVKNPSSDLLDFRKTMFVRMRIPDLALNEEICAQRADLTFDYTFRRPYNLGKQAVHWVKTLPTRVTPEKLVESLTEWQETLHPLMQKAPVHAVILGERNDEGKESLRLSAQDIETFGDELAELVRQQGGSVALSTSHRTRDSEETIRKILAKLPEGTPSYAYDYSQGGPNSYLALLAAAKDITVTPDSMSNLSDAIATGKKVQTFTRAAPTMETKQDLSADYLADMRRQGLVQPLSDVLEYPAKPQPTPHNSAASMAETTLRAWSKFKGAPDPRTISAAQRLVRWTQEIAL